MMKCLRFVIMGWIVDPSMSILILDDSVDICNSLRYLFSNRYTVITANTVNAAYEYLIDQKFGVVIIDYDLEDSMDGMTFAEYVKTISPLSFTIMLTGHSEFNLVKRALNEGNIDKYIIKPFESDELENVVKNALVHYSSRREISEMLKSNSGVAMAQDLLTQLLEENLGDKVYPKENEGKIDLSAVIISKNSIPVYSRFLSKEYLKNFTDTIFSGFMNAIHMVGQEVFTDESHVDLIKFGNYSIYFRFYDQYQFSFILGNLPHHIGDNELQVLEPFINNIISNLDLNNGYFNAKNNYIQEIDSMLTQFTSYLIGL